MQIGSISNTTVQSSNSVSNADNLQSTIENLQSQIETLENNSDMDKTQRDAQIQVLENRIQQLQSRIKQSTTENTKQLETYNNNTKENISSNAQNGDEIRGGVIISASLKDIINANHSIEE